MYLINHVQKVFLQKLICSHFFNSLNNIISRSLVLISHVPNTNLDAVDIGGKGVNKMEKLPAPIKLLLLISLQ